MEILRSPHVFHLHSSTNLWRATESYDNFIQMTQLCVTTFAADTLHVTSHRPNSHDNARTGCVNSKKSNCHCPFKFIHLKFLYKMFAIVVSNWTECSFQWMHCSSACNKCQRIEMYPLTRDNMHLWSISVQYFRQQFKCRFHSSMEQRASLT